MAKRGASLPKVKSRPRPRFKFIQDFFSELKQVTWPTQREAIRLSVMVIIVSLFMGLLLGVVDYGFSNLITKVFVGGP